MGVTSEGFYWKYPDQEPGGPIQDISFYSNVLQWKIIFGLHSFYGHFLDAYHSQNICKFFGKQLHGLFSLSTNL